MIVENLEQQHELLLREYARLEIVQFSDVRFGELSPMDNLMRLEKYRSEDGFYCHKFYEEFKFISDELMYHTGMCSLLLPHVNNPIKEGGTYLQSLADHRYLMFASGGYQAVYRLWDRIGDLLHTHLKTGLRSHRAYPKAILQSLEFDCSKSEHYKWLKEQFDDKVGPFLDGRNEIVHERGVSRFYVEWIYLNQRPGAVQELQSLKEQIVPDLIEQYRLAHEGLGHAVELVSEFGKGVRKGMLT